MKTFTKEQVIEIGKKLANAELIKNEIMVPAAKWYCEYCEWEDYNILKDSV